jgi:hypothetical protein
MNLNPYIDAAMTFLVWQCLTPEVPRPPLALAEASGGEDDFELGVVVKLGSCTACLVLFFGGFFRYLGG